MGALGCVYEIEGTLHNGAQASDCLKDSAFAERTSQVLVRGEGLGKTFHCGSQVSSGRLDWLWRWRRRLPCPAAAHPGNFIPC